MLKRPFRHGGRLSLVLASLILGAQVASAQQQVQITTKLETRPEMLIGEVYLFLVTEEKANLKLTKEPAYQSSNPRYMKAQIGNSPTKGNLAVVMDEAGGKPPRVYVDANNNGDLSDDANPDWTRGEYDVLHKDITIRAAFIVNAEPRVVDLPYRILYFSREEQERQRIALQPRFDRSGVLSLGGREYRVIAHTLNNRGLYSDLKAVTFGVDRNLDGKVDGSRLSGEIFDAAEPFNIAGESYLIKSISELGEAVTVEVSPTKVAPKEHVVVGECAPDFEFQTLEGQKLRLSDFRGRVLMLDFMATWCGPCIAALPETKKLRDRYEKSKFETISVSLDGGESSNVTRDELKEFARKHQMDWPVFYDGGGWKNLAARKYNVVRLPVHLIVDQKGMIQLIGRSGGDEETERVKAMVARLIGE
jgi:thiol-disulfide isomerase/thioredoxin